MPELPEVETMIRGIRPHARGAEIVELRKCRCCCKPNKVSPHWTQLRKRVTGTQINEVTRLAKRIVFELSSGDRLVIEPRMTGLLLLEDAPSKEHLRFEWRLAGKGGERSIWFWDRRGLGTMSLYDEDEFAVAFGPSKIGPDALLMTFSEWKAACARTKRAIKVALLDQKMVAGIGNLYASEILHISGIDPRCPANELKPAKLLRMAKVIVDVLETAIRYEGSTLGDGTYRNALNADGGYQNQHRVYARDGEICLTCKKTPIERIVQAQRSTFFCPRCQRPATR